VNTDDPASEPLARSLGPLGEPVRPDIGKVVWHTDLDSLFTTDESQSGSALESQAISPWAHHVAFSYIHPSFFRLHTVSRGRSGKVTAFQTSPRWETVRTRRGTRRRASIAATVGLLLTLSSCGEVGQKQGQASGSDQLATELVSGVAVHLNDVGASPRLQIRLKGSAWTTVSLPSEKAIGRLEVGPGKSTSEMLVVATDCLPEGDENLP